MRLPEGVDAPVGEAEEVDVGARDAEAPGCRERLALTQPAVGEIVGLPGRPVERLAYGIGIPVAVGDEHDLDGGVRRDHAVQQAPAGDGLVVGMRSEHDDACPRRQVKGLDRLRGVDGRPRRSAPGRHDQRDDDRFHHSPYRTPPARDDLPRTESLPHIL